MTAPTGSDSGAVDPADQLDDPAALDPDNVRPPQGQAPPAIGPGRMAAMGMPTERSKDFKNSTRRLLARLRPERTGAIIVIALAIVSVSMSVVGPKILGRATNIVVAGLFNPAGIDFASLHRTLLFVLGLYVVSSTLQYVQSYVLAGVVQRTMFGLRAEVEDKLNKLPLNYVDGQPRGDLLSRVTNDIDNVAQSLQQTLSQMLTGMLSLIGVLIMMVVISPLLAVVSFITVPLSLFTMKAIAKRSKKRFVAQWSHTGALNAQVEEAFTGHSLVKVFGRQQDVEQRFSETNDRLYEASFAAQFISGVIQPAMMFVGNLNYVAIAVIGGLRVASGSMTLGDVQAFIQYSRQFTQPLTQMASMANVLQSGVASAERVFELLDAVEEYEDDALVSDAPAPTADGDTADATRSETVGRVEFAHVKFSYEPGRTVAIVGPTGAGKTTLVNLIMRFYELDGGAILLDGRDISQIPRRELRSNIGMVLQDTWLFGGTIRENIAYGNLGASEEQLLEAARATYVDRFVHALPEGYDTVLTDEGSSVSAGEKQLLTIARAFLADPAILILDEATSSVDTRTEVLIQRAMSALRSNRTSFVIAHRLSTIRDADVILVMDGGRIVEQGTHDELLARHGAYFALYHAQFAAAAAEIA